MKTAKEKAEEFLAEGSFSTQDWAVKAVTHLLKEQDHATRHACVDAVYEYYGTGEFTIDGIDTAIMNTVAV
jgi:hypothetical protein